MDLNYQKIMDLLSDVLPRNWVKIIFLAEYTSGSYGMKYYADLGTGKYLDCYKISPKLKLEFIKIFKKINQEISSVRNALEDNKKWYSMTMSIDKDFNFKVDFDYKNHEENTLGFMEEWEKKYIK